MLVAARIFYRQRTQARAGLSAVLLLAGAWLAPSAAWCQELPAPAAASQDSTEEMTGVRPYIGSELGMGSASLTFAPEDYYSYYYDRESFELSGRGALWGVAGGLIIGTPKLGFSFGVLRREFSTALECDCEEASWNHTSTGVQLALRASYFYAGLNIQDVEGELDLQTGDDGRLPTTQSKTLGLGLDLGLLYRIKFLAVGGMFSVLSADDSDAGIENTTMALTATAQLIF